MADDQPNSQDPLESELVRDDPSLGDIVIEFVEGLPERVDTMQQSLDDADFGALRTTAHQLKGSGGGYGYPLVTDRARELELHATSSAVAECTAALNELRKLSVRISAGAPKPD